MVIFFKKLSNNLDWGLLIQIIKKGRNFLLDLPITISCRGVFGVPQREVREAQMKEILKEGFYAPFDYQW